ncbi:MAG: tetratricopeptide repeat protein [bacterium]
MMQRSLLIVTALVFSGGFLWSQSNRGDRLVYIHSDPMYAQILVDGTAVHAVTPAVISLEGRGPHSVTLRKSGYRPYSLEIDADGRWPRPVRVSLARTAAVTRFEGAETLRLGDMEVEAERFALETPEGDYRLSAGGTALSLERVYPREGLRRAAGIAVPALALVAILGGLDDAAEPAGPLYVGPGTMAAAGLTAVSAGVYAGLTVEKARYLERTPILLAETQTPGAAAALHARAEQAFRLGSFEEARDLYEELLKTHPESGLVPESIRLIGEIYRILQRPHTARTFLARIPERYPDPAEVNSALLSLSEIEVDLGNADAAAQYLHEIHPNLGGVTPRQIRAQQSAIMEAAGGSNPGMEDRTEDHNEARDEARREERNEERSNENGGRSS